MRPMPVSVLVGVVKGRALVRLLDQMELLNGVLDHTLLQLPRIDWQNKTQQGVNVGFGTGGQAGRYEGMWKMGWATVKFVLKQMCYI